MVFIAASRQLAVARNLLKAVGRKLKAENGYTMIEMISFLAILGVLSGLVIANTSFGDKRQRVRDAASLFVAAARSAESAALTSRTVPDATSKLTARRAYGICVTTQTAVETGGKCVSPGADQANAFQVYARTVADTELTCPPAAPDILASHRLPPETSFTVSYPPLTCSQPAATSWFADYLPPQPKLQVNGDGLSERELSVTYDGYGKTVIVKPAAGAVYVQ